MPHQCVRCSALYDDGAREILDGCTCGGKFFFFINRAKYERIQAGEEEEIILSEDEKEQIENDVYDIMGNSIDRDQPVILDIESIKIIAPGKYELDLVNLMQNDQPLIYKVGDGKYIVDVVESFAKMSQRNKKKKK